MSHTPYQPIACSQYDVYEIAIMHGDWLELLWHDELGVERCERVKPIGLQTQDGEEFLLFQRNTLPTNAVQRVRLDRLQSIK